MSYCQSDPFQDTKKTLNYYKNKFFPIKIVVNNKLPKIHSRSFTTLNLKVQNHPLPIHQLNNECTLLCNTFTNFYYIQYSA